MFWVGLLIALLAGVASIDIFRDALLRRYPRLGGWHLDLIAAALIVLGLGLAAYDHVIAQFEFEELVEDHQVLKGVVAGFRQKEEQKNFTPLALSHQKELTAALGELVQEYPDANLEFRIYCVAPSADQFKKVSELVSLFNDANIPTEYSNTAMSATTNLFLSSPELNKELIDDVIRMLKIVFLVDQIPVEVDDDRDDRLLKLYFLGDPLFDNEGRVFY